jgi:hypothetical protein
VLFAEQIPRPLFDAIVMTYRYKWRAMSYAFFMHGHLERWQRTTGLLEDLPTAGRDDLDFPGRSAASC